MLELDKDKVMPLIDGLAVVAQWEDGPDIADKVSGAQRDADWRVMERLLEVCKAIDDEFDFGGLLEGDDSEYGGFALRQRKAVQALRAVLAGLGVKP